MQNSNWYRGTANWCNNYLNDTLVDDEPHNTREMIREAANKLEDAADHIDKLTAELRQMKEPQTLQ